MDIQKELKDISWQVDEPTYRADEALSYSTLSTYESLGFNGLDSLFEKKESPSLTLGSCVDAIITGGKEEFDKQFFVADFPPLGEKETKIADYLFSQFGQQYDSFGNIPQGCILDAANTFEFQKNWKDDTKVKVLSERCFLYYKLKYDAGNKTIVDADTFQKVQACVMALRQSPATSGYFADNDMMSPVRRYYQLKFKATFDGVTYRNMADELIVDYEKKKVYPIDLKTSSTPEWDFEKSFVKWHYYIQAMLYWRIIRANMDADDYFKDFSLENYRFIVVNPKTLTPLVWEFPFTKMLGTLVDEENTEWRDPFEIGKELQGYLNLRPQVPNGISMDGTNTIKCLHKKGSV